MTEKTGLNICYLIGCALQNREPEPDRVKEMNLQELYREARFHSVSAIVYMALASASAFEAYGDDALRRKWKEAKEKAVRKTLLLNVERMEILEYMEREGIWYLPLKGILLQELYPKPGMRQMADNDILYDAACQEKLCRYMKSRGYTAISVGRENHDVYQKPPVYNFEMHTSLYGAVHQKGWAEYYANVKERLIPDCGRHFGYHFKEEDFYIYMTTHTYKHFDGAGTGLRSLMDCYVYLEQKSRLLDWSYIRVELDKLGLTAFEEQCRRLSKKVFATDKQVVLEQEEAEMFRIFLTSGTYGTMDNKVERRIKGIVPEGQRITVQAKIRYCIKRLFPDWNHIKTYCPIAYKHKYLIPFYFLFRLVRGVTFRRKKVRRELQAVRKITK